jgi:hypothetical protein
MIKENAKDSKIIYQVSDDDMSLPEPAIIINNWLDVISIDGEYGSININRKTVPELIKVLREYQKKIPK